MFEITEGNIMVIGAHPQIIQSILDFDFACGAAAPSIVALVGGGRASHKCWFGDTEILLPIYGSVDEAKAANIPAEWLLNIASANSARKMTEQFFGYYPDAKGAHLFCEGLAEQDALALIQQYGSSKLIAGASGVGLLVPTVMKLGAIGGIFGSNVNVVSRMRGTTAIICSSGGMVNELIDTLIRAGGAPSFAVSFGGDRFPITSPLQWCLAAQADPHTEHIVYFGELGGVDEHDIARAIREGVLTKPVAAYIAGRYESGEEKVQFGHAKALANTPDEDAHAKMRALSESGVRVAKTFQDFITIIKQLPHHLTMNTNARVWDAPEAFRKSSLFTAVADRGSSSDPFVRHALCTLLEKKAVSDELVTFTERAYSLLIDHGAEVSGAVNTMITARAGRDLSSALATGILTVGDRFGGAINKAAETWYRAVRDGVSVDELLEAHKARGEYVMGIGHRKYSVHNNDPRVAALIATAKELLSETPHLNYALSVAERTTQKKPSLILNVDGTIAATVLDLLQEHERYTASDIATMLEIEFFNSYFLIPRTVGFIGNFLSQKRRDEGLFRLPENEVFYE